MPRSLPDERLTPSYSAVLSSLFPFKRKVGAGTIAAAIASTRFRAEGVARFARPTPIPSLEREGLSQ